MRSAVEHPEVVSEYLAEEVAAGRVVGPLPEEVGVAWHMSRFGVIPKPNKWRLIVDLSYPPVHSVNDGIDPELCSLKYTRVEEVAEFLWHYLDDFITVGRGGTGECELNISIFNHVCRRLGIPLAADKCEGPATCLTFLGIEIDSQEMEFRLPAEKLQRLRQEIGCWAGKKSCARRELQSLTGHLQHTATVVRPGRTFIRRLYDLVAVTKAAHHHVRLNSDAGSDLAWWATFLESWNDISLVSASQQQVPRHVVVSDASGSWGCGAYYAQEWFQLEWASSTLAGASIAVQELIPLVVAVALWGSDWRGDVVSCKTDNAAVVAVIATRTSRDKHIMQLLRCLFFLEAKDDCHLVASHIPGVHNELAAHLSRN